MVSFGADNTIQLYDNQTEACLRTYHFKRENNFIDDGIVTGFITKDESSIISISLQGLIQVWDSSPYLLEPEPKEANKIFLGVEISNDNRYILSVNRS